MEYLVTMTTHVPDGTPEQAVQDIRTRAARHSAELAAQDGDGRNGPSKVNQAPAVRHGGLVGDMQ